MNTIKINSISEMPKNYTGNVEYRNGTKEWYRLGKLHREDGPAVEYPHGTRYWCKDGLTHREDGPAFESEDGYKEWWIDNDFFTNQLLEFIIKESIFLGIENGRYNLFWYKFLTEEGIKEFPIIPGMKEEKVFEKLFQTLNQIIAATIT